MGLFKSLQWTQGVDGDDLFSCFLVIIWLSCCWSIVDLTHPWLNKLRRITFLGALQIMRTETNFSFVWNNYLGAFCSLETRPGIIARNARTVPIIIVAIAICVDVIIIVIVCSYSAQTVSFCFGWDTWAKRDNEFIESIHKEMIRVLWFTVMAFARTAQILRRLSRSVSSLFPCQLHDAA